MLNPREKSKGKKAFYFFVFLLLGISLLLFILIFYFKSSMVLEKRQISTSLSVGNTTGFNVTTDSISFGKLTRGNAALRDDVSITNNYDFPIVIEISLDGNIKEFLKYEDEVFLNPNESKNLSFSTIEITDQEEGSYTGVFSFVFKKARI